MFLLTHPHCPILTATSPPPVANAPNVAPCTPQFSCQYPRPQLMPCAQAFSIPAHMGQLLLLTGAPIISISPPQCMHPRQPSLRPTSGLYVPPIRPLHPVPWWPPYDHALPLVLAATPHAFISPSASFLVLSAFPAKLSFPFVSSMTYHFPFRLPAPLPMELISVITCNTQGIPDLHWCTAQLRRIQPGIPDLHWLAAFGRC